ncbi:ABC transporter permease [Clostridium cellulovorans]|uniref:Inner-membrane translocator n=1 Tax=Clostridium cellulovorans (strain ATCC 35296 / DSM 3052 / OCM 3 / 743B) TaxID=573061 RepID=D9SLR3_CLOC7|nr:ABC transporter [Clostridium cellulovorans]ADL53700.1 inner-membrane translocator [Clostridium cellulovorans 743B]
MDIIIGSLELGFIYAIVAIGVYITYKILDFPDMSVDGTMPLGAAVTAVMIAKGMNPFIATIVAIIAGCIGGATTGLLHVKLKINNLMAGILVMIGLYSINLRVMGKANTQIFGSSHFLSKDVIPKIVVLLIFAIIVKILLDVFLKTKKGFILRAVGDNEQLVTSLAINKDNYKILGLVISNGLAALAGALLCQYQNYADVGMGAGTVVIGLAAVIVGESIFGRISFMKATTTAALGAIIYRLAVTGVLELGLDPQDLKLVTAVIVIVALSLNTKHLSFKSFKKAKNGGATVVNNNESI